MSRYFNVNDSSTLKANFFAYARNGNLKQIKLLLDRGMFINTQNSTGGTILREAVFSRNIEVVEFLLANGADPNLVDNRGYNTVYHARELNREKMIELLLAAGGKDEARKLSKEEEERNKVYRKKQKLEKKLAVYEMEMQKIASGNILKAKHEKDRKLIESQKAIIEQKRRGLLQSKCPSCNTIPDRLGRCNCS